MAINKAKTSIKDKVNRIKSKYVKGEIEPKATALSKTYAKKEATLTKYKRGGRTIAQTPAPKSDRIYGSKKNIKGSASTEGSNIKLSKKTVEVLKQKLKEFKEKHPNADNITLSDLEKIYRRGSGAYSKSHRPTITGGVPNTRAAWSFARVNKFLEKAAGESVKKAYVQDDDLLKYEDGGNLKYNDMKETIIALPDTYSSEERLKDILKEQGYDIVKSYEHGGEVQPDDKKTKNMITHKSGSAGGMLVGNRHSEGGIKAINKSTDTPLEMEGGEVVITRNAVSDSKKREFEGEMLTNRQILSRINESGGGVSFAKGGDIPHKCSCSGKSYAYGGKTMTDYEIIDDIHNDYNSRMFGVQHLDKSNSECCELLFVPTEQYEKSVHLYSEGGMIRLVHKKVPSYKSFAQAHTDISGVAMKKSYKMKLKNEYDVDFDKLPQNIKVALLIGNQKLVDNYLNS